MKRIINGFTLVLVALVWNSCSDSSEEMDPCVNGPSLSVDELRDAVAGEDDGEIVVSVSGGSGPYMYSIDGENFQSSSTFSDLPAGNYTVTVKDANDCESMASASISEIPLVSFSNQVKPIIDGNCQVSGCHGSNQNIPSWATYDDIAARASSIKSNVTAGTMPPPGVGSLTDDEVNLISGWVDQGALNN